MAERAVAHNLSPSASGDDGEQNPRCRARTPPSPSRRSLGREEALEGVEKSATSPLAGDGEGRRDGERRLLVYGDGSTPQGMLQAAGALLRHPPVVPDPETPARRWLDDVANLVMTAQQHLGTGRRSSATKASGVATTGSASSRRRARRAAAVTRCSSAIPSSTLLTQEDVRGGPDARLNVERRRNGRRAAHATEGASSSGAPLWSGHGGQPPMSPVGGAGCCHAQKFPNRIPSRMCIKTPVQDQPGYTNDNVDIQIHREHHSTGILDGTDEAYSSENPPSDTYSSSEVGGKRLTSARGAAPTGGSHRDPGKRMGRRRHVATGPTAPIYPWVDRTAARDLAAGARGRGARRRRPWRRRRGAHTAAAHMRQRRKATTGGDRPAAESGG
uniref:Uncharacterized protein n=1 Tax=Oryza sativa subsp. japonica TaxID=39947 RepID=Q6UTY9_ORYSJ|nr:hypothetical protein OSJNBa0070J19.25 [Oryza sativa Japonica Group]